MDQIAVVVVHFNQNHLTDDCLRSLNQIKTKKVKWQVLVVDNGSVEPYALPKDISQDHFILIRSDANLGFTGGNNLGIHKIVEQSNPDYICLLNNDTVVAPDFLQSLSDWSSIHAEMGVVCPKIYFAPGKEYHKDSFTASQRGRVLWYAGGSIDWQHLSFFHRGVDEVDRGQFDHQIESDFATGCCMWIQRAVLEKIGYFDKRYFMYGEDVDFSLRAEQQGYKIGFCASSQVWHVNAGSSGGSGSELQQYYQDRNRYLLAFLYGPIQAKFAMLRLQAQAVLSGSHIKQTAVWHFYLRNFGKQPLW